MFKFKGTEKYNALLGLLLHSHDEQLAARCAEEDPERVSLEEYSVEVYLERLETEAWLIGLRLNLVKATLLITLVGAVAYTVVEVQKANAPLPTKEYCHKTPQGVTACRLYPWELPP